MQLTFKEKISFISNKFDVYDENGNICFTTVCKLKTFTRQVMIYDSNNNLIGELKEKARTFYPCFTIIENGQEVETIKIDKKSFNPKFILSSSSWVVDGNFLDRKYTISKDNQIIASINRKVFSVLDTYYLDILKKEDTLKVLMVVLAIEIIKLNWQEYYAIYITNTQF